MIVLYKGEEILFEKEARLKLGVKLDKQKVEGKGTLYITNIRIVFEDYRQGILTQFTYHDIHGYRKVKGLLGEKLSIDFKRSDIKTDYQGTLLAEFEFKGVEDAYKLLSMLTNNNNTNNNTIIGYTNVQNNHYNMMNTSNRNINNESDDMPEWMRPWIVDIKFTWNTVTRGKELGLISHGNEPLRPWHYFELYVNRIDRDFKNYVKFDTSKFNNDFKYKVAREAYRMRAILPYEKYFTYDSNRYWVGIIQHAYKDGKDELVGININAESGSGFFIYNPKDWYDWFLIVVRFGYDYERDEPSLIGIGSYNKEDETKRLTLAKECKRYYFAILNKDFKTAEDAWGQISETYRKYDTEDTWLNRTGKVGLVLKYAIEMDKRNIPYPTTVKRSPI
jgi:hypothetical protein